MSEYSRLPSVWEPVFALVILCALLIAFVVKTIKLSDVGSVKNRVHLVRVFVAVLLATVALTGCKSTVPGRFVALKWDSRSPEQLVAAQISDTAVYGSVAPVPQQESAPRFAEWVALAKVISEFRTLFEIGVVEWGSDIRPVTAATPITGNGTK